MKRFLFLKLTIIFFFLAEHTYSQEIIPDDAFVTAAFATGGSSPHKDKVFWLTWGSQSEEDLYGKIDQNIVNGSASYGKIHLGGGKYLKISAVISDLEYKSGGTWYNVPSYGGYLASYIPGNYMGDSMDDLYNIGGVGSDNKLVSGLRNEKDAGEVRFKVTAKATIDDIPVRLNGMVLGDAESLASNENFYAIGKGQWTVVDLKKNIGSGPYNVEKIDLGDNLTKLSFDGGNDDNTGAVAFLTFDETAYLENEAVEFEVQLKGGGRTAISLGLLPSSIDGGDAPESYGPAFHLLDSFMPTNDHISVGGGKVNLNVFDYAVGDLKMEDGSYLGSTAPDGDLTLMYSSDALGDDSSGNAGPLEEDAWPENLRRFSYNAFYKTGDQIVANIEYTAVEDGWISGWIDFDKNGKFDDNERVTVFAKKATKGLVNMTWIVPEKRVVKSTFVRLRLGHVRDEVLNPIGLALGGEVEDHRIYILSPTRTNPTLLNEVK